MSSKISLKHIYHINSNTIEYPPLNPTQHIIFWYYLSHTNYYSFNFFHHHTISSPTPIKPSNNIYTIYNIVFTLILSIKLICLHQLYKIYTTIGPSIATVDLQSLILPIPYQRTISITPQFDSTQFLNVFHSFCFII